MATNGVYYPADTLRLPVPAETKSGDYVVVGVIAGVALEDRDSGGTAPVRVKGVYKLPVKGHDGSANKAVAIGDRVYYDEGTLNLNSSGTDYGVALEIVASGEIATIKVALTGGI